MGISQVSKLEIARAVQKEQETSQAMLLQQAEIESLLKQLSIAAEEKESLLQQIGQEMYLDKSCSKFECRISKSCFSKCSVQGKCKYN